MVDTINTLYDASEQRGRTLTHLWRSLKYESVSLRATETGSQAKIAIGRWINFYNHPRPHAAHDVQPPARVYFNSIKTNQRGRRVAKITPETVQQFSSIRQTVPLDTRIINAP